MWVMAMALVAVGHLELPVAWGLVAGRGIVLVVPVPVPGKAESRVEQLMRACCCLVSVVGDFLSAKIRVHLCLNIYTGATF